MKNKSFIKTLFILCLSIGFLSSQTLMGIEHKENLPQPDGKAADMTKPVKVYILMGQSNMLGFGAIKGSKEGTLEYTVKNKKRYTHLMDKNGKWTQRKDVRNVRVMGVGDKMSVHNNEWHTVSGSTFGPEIQIGHIMGEIHQEPVMILKSCIGNRALGWDLLPPGSESYEVDGKEIPGYQGSRDPELRPKGAWYAGKQWDTDTDNIKKVLENLKDYYPGATKYEVAGFVWWQGHKDQNAKWAPRYEQNLVQLIKALREEFTAPKAKFVCATIAFGGKNMKGHTLTVAEAQLAVSDYIKYPEHEGNVKSVDVRSSWRGGGAHYGGHAETYMEVGNALGWALADLVSNDPKETLVHTDVKKKKKGKKTKNNKEARGPYASLEKQNLMLSPNNIAKMMQTYALRSEKKLKEQDRFLMHYFSKNWDGVEKIMQTMDRVTSEKVYARVIHSLANTKEKPLLTPSDIVRIMELPGSHMNSQVSERVATIIKASILPEEETLLAKTFEERIKEKGYGEKRLMIAQVLMKTNFKKSALQFMPKLEDAKKIKDRGIREMVMDFHHEQMVQEDARLDGVSEVLNKKYGELLKKSSDKRAKEAAMNDLLRYIYTLSPATLKLIVSSMFEHDEELCSRFLISALEKMTHVASRDRTGKNHSHNLYVLNDMADLLKKFEVDYSNKTWKSITGMMANLWLAEVDYTLKQWPNHLKRRKSSSSEMGFAKPNHLMAMTPSGDWTAYVSKDTMNRIQLILPRVMLISSEPDRAIHLIVDMAKHNPKAATVLGQEFIKKWADIHDPEIPAHIIKTHKLPEATSIVVTPIMIRRNIEDFSKIMTLLRKQNVVPGTPEELVAAFGACYGNAEAYLLEDIEKVFGPIDQIPSPLFFALVKDMALSLGDRWRNMANQKKAVTSRRQADLLEMVRRGYDDVVKMIDQRLKIHPDDWRTMTACGTLLSDWGDYEYFQNLKKSTSQERMARYKEKNNLAYAYFDRAATTYIKSAGKSASVDNTVFMAWFNSLLGLNSNGEINLSKAMNRDVLLQMREIIRMLPDHLAQRHLDEFAKVIETKTSDKKNPMPAELKYKYLASALEVIKDSPFSMDTEKQVAYYQELLKEVRLKTQIDGENAIWRKEDFGIIISLRHSDVMGDLINFNKYLEFKTSAPVSNRRKAAPKAKIMKMSDAKLARNEFEKNIMEAFGNFFEIKSITFSPTNVEPRKIDKPGWSETVLAYVQVRARGISVDRIPPIELDLDYFDLSGPVTIPVTSSETMIQMREEKGNPRPYGNLEIIQQLDTRQLFVNGKIKLEIKAKGTGLIPDLEDIVDLAPLQNSVKMKSIDQVSGPSISELNTWAKDVHVLSSREWSITIDGKELIESDVLHDVYYPIARHDDTLVQNETYVDVELLAVTDGRIQVSQAGVSGQSISGETILMKPSNTWLWVSIAIAVVAFVIGLIVFLKTIESKDQDVSKASDVFKMPHRIDPFVVVRLLRSLRNSDLVHMKADERHEINQEIRRIEETCFDPAKEKLNEAELKQTVSKWLKKTC